MQESHEVLRRLDEFIDELRSHEQYDLNLEKTLFCIVQKGLDRIPKPGQGNTLLRWKAFTKLAAVDLSLCKLYEAHTDSLAIIDELNACEVSTDGKTWGIWAAEPPNYQVHITEQKGNQARLTGCKAWCSGAPILTDALVTCWREDNQPQLVAVPLKQLGVRITHQGWYAIGMAGTQSVEVEFNDAVGQCVGQPGDYLKRPGFWHGGAGVAACWYGGVIPLAEALYMRCQKEGQPHEKAHLGAVESALMSAKCSLMATAQWIDTYPLENAALVTRRLRSICETTALSVIEHVHHALGAYPYCKSPYFARLLADLPVFLSQSHGERDLADLGELVAAQEKPKWAL